VNKFPCKNYTDNTVLNLTVGLGGAGATVVNTTTPTGTMATRGGNSAFSVTSGTITYTISSTDVVGAAPHTYTLVNNGHATSENNATITTNFNPVTLQQGAGSGGGGGACQSQGQKVNGVRFYGGSGGGSGASGGDSIAWEFDNGAGSDRTINGYASSGSGGGGGPNGQRPTRLTNDTTIRLSGYYFYNQSDTNGGSGSSFTNSEFSNETITYGGGGGWAMPSGMNIDTGWSFLSVTRVFGGAGGGGAGVYNGGVANGNYTNADNGTNGLGGGGGALTVRWSNGDNTGNNARGGHGGNGVVVVIFTLV